MTFLNMPSTSRLVPGAGSKDARLAIVGDYTDNFDRNSLRPFSGPPGSILESCLHAAGLIRGEVYLTNLFKEQEQRYTKLAKGPNNYFNEADNSRTCKFTDKGLQAVGDLLDELAEVKANIIVACGRAASLALLGTAASSMYRGYVFAKDIRGKQRKVIPTHHPSGAIRGNYTYRHMIICDLRKAALEAKFPELKLPERTLIYEYSSVEEALQWLEYFVEQDVVSADIEVLNFATSVISFSSSPDLACVIPLASRWNEDEELQIRRRIQRVLGNPKSVKIMQNGIFDIQFLLAQDGIEVRGEVRDTMIGHSVMYPELPKGLGFLGSIYCGSQPYWKDKVNFNDIKENS